MSTPDCHLMESDALERLRGANAEERLVHRLHCVALAQAGILPKDIARIFGDSPRAIAYWIARFKKSGIAGLEEEAGRGRRSQLTSVQLKKVASFVEANSEKVTGAALSAFLKKSFDVNLTVRHVGAYSLVFEKRCKART